MVQSMANAGLDSVKKKLAKPFILLLFQLLEFDMMHQSTIMFFT